MIATNQAPYWYLENLDFKRRNNALLDQGEKLINQAVSLSEEIRAFINQTQTETGITDLKQISQLPQAKPYIEMLAEVQMLKMRSDALLGRFAECERVRLGDLSCLMQTYGIDRIPESWKEVKSCQ